MKTIEFNSQSIENTSYGISRYSNELLGHLHKKISKNLIISIKKITFSQNIFIKKMIQIQFYGQHQSKLPYSQKIMLLLYMMLSIMRLTVIQ